MSYAEVDLRFTPLNPTRDIISYELGELGFEAIVETEQGLKAYLPESEFNEKMLDGLQYLIAESKIEYTVKTIPDQNWNAQWEASFEPVRVGKQCMIRATFHEPDAAVEYDVVINPQMSFGTGHHVTTQLMVAEILKLDLEAAVVADVGCGTGVLGILAEMRGAEAVSCVDIDDWACNNTQANIALNNCVKTTVNKGSFEKLQELAFNCIFANINKNVLKHDLPAYFRSLKQGGTLLLSGFFETDSEELIGIGKKLGLVFVGTATNGDWAVLKFMKPETK